MTTACLPPHWFSFTALIVVFAGCASSSTPTNGENGTNPSNGTAGDGGAQNDGGRRNDGGSLGPDSSSRSSFACCVGGKFFGCPDMATLTKCSPSSSEGECMANCMGDPTCLQGCSKAGNPDTSACTRTASRDSECASSCPGVENTSFDTSCSGDPDCASASSEAHCFAGRCYLNSAGAPCSSPSQCGNVAQCVSGCCKL